MEKRPSLGVVLLLVFTLVAFGVSVQKRFWQFSKWNEYREFTYAKDGRVSMTTADAYFFLRLAKEYKRGTLKENKKDPLRAYPDGMKFPSPGLLPILLAKLSVFFKGDIYMTGIYLIPFLASLFIIPLVIYFYRIGLGLIGLAGGLFGTFSVVYYVRTSNGRVDTDALNLFFPVCIGLFYLLIIQTKNKRNRYIYAGIAGISMALFSWWYQRYQFALLYPLFFVVLLVINKFRLKDIVILTGIFVIFSGPVNVYRGIYDTFNFLFRSGFLQKESIRIGSIVWPNIMETITESKKEPASVILSIILRNPIVTSIGIVGITLIVLRRFKEMFPLFPLLAIGLLAFVAGKRFAMFLAPFVGVGIGYFVYLGIQLIKKYFNLKDYIVQMAVPACILLLFFATADTLTAYNKVFPPKIPVSIVNGIIDLKKTVPKGSPVFTWWDWGYAITDIGEFAVYHDGGTQGGIRSYLVAKAFVTNDPSEMYSIISAIDNFKFKGLMKQLTKTEKKPIKDRIKEILNFNDRPKNENIIVLYTQDMIGKFGAISIVGNWDFEKKKTSINPYLELKCYELKMNILKCGNINIDIEKGLINNRIRLKRLIFTQNGYVIRKKIFPYNTNKNLELLLRDNKVVGVFVINEQVYQSNFNQMFLLGNYDRRLFEEIYNSYPFVRAFRVKR